MDTDGQNYNTIQLQYNFAGRHRLENMIQLFEVAFIKAFYEVET